MCGRYTSITPTSELARFFSVDEVVADETGPRYNVAPTDEVPAVAVAGGRTVLGTLRWGLVPPWAGDPRVGSRMINARAESIHDKPAFRRAFARRRCLMPADGFYEWEVGPGGVRRPWYFRHRDGEPLALAAVWESWVGNTGPDPADRRLVSCAIVTAAANDTVAPVHPRMPVVLDRATWEAWLDPECEGSSLHGLLAPAPPDLLEAVPVGRQVNAVTNDGPELIEAVG